MRSVPVERDAPRNGLNLGPSDGADVVTVSQVSKTGRRFGCAQGRLWGTRRSHETPPLSGFMLSPVPKSKGPGAPSS
jgi:hypothetical protein